MKARNNKKVLVCGSIVVDSLFDLNGTIRDAVNFKDGKNGKQNLMFTAHEKEEYFGGTAGNIAYGLGLLKENPIVASVVGKDFDGYKSHLKHLGAELRILMDEKGYTATFYGMTDNIKEQIGIFQPNAYGKHIESVPLSRLLKSADWGDVGIAIFSAGTAKSIVKHMKEFKAKNKEALTIFDPGQTLLATFTEKLLAEAIKSADMIIVNDTEYSYLHNHFGFTLEKIFKGKTKFVIETKGADGSVLHEPKGKTIVKSIKVKKVVDPTGAGDAYRAGLISGMLRGKTIEESMMIGAKLGAKCVQSNGGQTYSI
jgi:adenosine kinase